MLSMGSHRVRDDWSDLAAAAAEHHYIFYAIDWNQGEGVQLVPVVWIAGTKHGGTFQLSGFVVVTHSFFNNNHVHTYCLLSASFPSIHEHTSKTL